MSKFIAALIVGAGVTLAALPATAQEGLGMRTLLGAIGLVTPDKEPIDYRARPPLVVPPAMKLQEPSAPGASRNANWPNDPDVAARRAAAKDSLIPATEREKYIQGQRPLLSQEELRKGTINTPAPTAPPARSAFDQSPYEVMTQPILIGREIAAQRNAKTVDEVKLGQEPPRRYLSDPPPGLRKPAGSGEYTKTSDIPVQESSNGIREFTAKEGKR